MSGPDVSQPAKRLSPLLKWAGGKEQELQHILPNLPEQFEHFYEPFVGGGAVYTAIAANRYFINDKSEELIGLYRTLAGKEREAFFEAVDGLGRIWDALGDLPADHRAFFLALYRQYAADTTTEEALKKAVTEFVTRQTSALQIWLQGDFGAAPEQFFKELNVNLLRKTRRMKVLEQARQTLPESDVLDNIETALKSAFYMYIRHLDNHAEGYRIAPPVKAATFFFLRNFAYSGMFRYNARGHFNVPYGGIGYNRNRLGKKIDYLRSAPLRALLEWTVIENLDFEAFFEAHPPGADDFVFLDPPYDSEFSTYAKNEFTRADQERLAQYLIRHCPARWMLIIKRTDFILNLYERQGLRIRSFKKHYAVSFMNRNDRQAEHLLITNY